ncbi:hypothetical protein [Urbifossiella limnaea]|uniref:Uncharacterized protein n=1 Tax=Urbifossiella limnaea TaxID=2528023 RepID=A0A517Y3K9_9BACT|nr:hypothetical protein [Urbifossiella limnaea]QDU24308.1 hypothetical protein ETAA1_63220 [Urbifossiella limnaea]
MSEHATTDASTDTTSIYGDQRRRRQYRIVARLLREYTARVYRIADNLGAYLDGFLPSHPDGSPPPRSVVTDVGRFRLVWEDILDAALQASQMLVHFRLYPAEEAELRLRLKDAEHVVGRTAELVNDIVACGGVAFGDPMAAERVQAAIYLSRRPFRR